MIKNLLNELAEFLNDFNTTSGRIVASLFLATITVISVLIMMFLSFSINLEVIIAVFSFILGLGGLDVIQFTQKRKTFMPQNTSDNPTNTATISSNRALGDEHGIEITD